MNFLNHHSAILQAGLGKLSFHSHKVAELCRDSSPDDGWHYVSSVRKNMRGELRKSSKKPVLQYDRCHKVGLVARECSNSDMGGGYRGRGGLRCSRYGLYARDSPEVSDHNRGYKCNGSEQIAKDYNNANDEPACYNCNKTGHIAKDCTDERKTCYFFKKSNHISRECAQQEDRKCYTCRQVGHLSMNWGDDGRRYNRKYYSCGKDLQIGTAIVGSGLAVEGISMTKAVHINLLKPCVESEAMIQFGERQGRGRPPKQHKNVQIIILQVLYWSDVSSEIAFIVPSPPNPRKPSITSLNTTVSSISQDSEAVSLSPQLSVKSFDQELSENGSNQQKIRIDNKQRAFSLDLDKTAFNKEFDQPARSSGRRYGRQASAAMGWDAKVIVVWLERYEDQAQFPIADMLQYTVNGFESSIVTPRSLEKDIFVIYIHSLHSGLFRIKMQGNMGKISLAIPLVDGMVVSRRVLATMVRQTALNMCRRRRLELESYQPPHVRRKLMIQDIVQKYKNSLTESEFYTSLFI
ncbi:Ral GTPase-activating protein subunit beta [Nymphon striatum]|nr:Ral GTPase-activating protein subunit beta [Nymphon striatum]